MTALTDSIFFGGAITLLAFLAGLWCKKRFQLAVFNPLLVAVVLIIAVLVFLDIDYSDYNEGAKYISYLLTPATVCLAIPLYKQLHLLKENGIAIVLSIISGSIAGMAGVLGMAAAFGLSHAEYVTLLPKSITTAIGMGVSEEVGGIVTITVAVIIATGILGNMIASGVCRLFHITDPIAAGLAIGTAAHAIGTARALEIGEIEGAMSSLSIAVAGIVTACTASFFAMLW